MTFYASPAFFVALVALIIPAAALGLSGRPIKRYGMAASAVMLALLFSGSAAQLVAFLAFVLVSTASMRLTLRSWRGGEGSVALYRACLAATLAPLVAYKLASGAGSGVADLVGFAGISYVTFRAVQVLIEIRDGLITELTVGDYLYFLTFFATITSGPIDRSRRFLADANAPLGRDEYADLLSRGVLLVLLGAVGQLVIATIALRYYQPDRPLVSAGLAYGVARQVANAYLYGIYLFFDFAGYSLMAMGVSYCLGIRCPRNFDAPYRAVDLKDFWNRWHITLSTWLRDFVFMRLVRLLTRRKLLSSRLQRACAGYVVNMLVMGAWHGLTADYLLYGLYHGVLLAGLEVWQKKSAFYRRNHQRRWYRVCSWFVTMQLVIIGFAIFSGQLSSIVGRIVNGL